MDKEIEVDKITEIDGKTYKGIGRPSDCFDHLLEYVDIYAEPSGEKVFSGSPTLKEARKYPTVIAELRAELENPTLIEPWIDNQTVASTPPQL